jgi:hypothetical protein
MFSTQLQVSNCRRRACGTIVLRCPIATNPIAGQAHEIRRRLTTNSQGISLPRDDPFLAEPLEKIGTRITDV